MARLITGLILTGLLVGFSESCSFPSYLSGDWVSSDVGPINFNGTAFGPYTVGSYGDFYFECYTQVGTKYTARSTVTHTILGNPQYFYLCLDLRFQSPNKYIYYLLTSQESAAANQRVLIRAATVSPTSAQTCDVTRPEHVYFTLLKNGTETSEKITCPDWFLAEFNYTTAISACASTGSSGTTCVDNTMVSLNYTLCNYPIFGSLGGNLNCLYHMSVGNTNYLTLYNLDSPAQYTIVCVVASVSGSTIYASYIDAVCGDAQTPTSSAIPTNTLEMTIFNTCPIPTPATPAPSKNSAPSTCAGMSFLMGLLLLAMALRV